MSANNHSECPICRLKKKNKLEELKQQYGKISAEEYHKLQKKIMKDDEDKHIVSEVETIREYYEVGVSDDGYAYIDFSAECTKCGASWQLYNGKILPEKAEDKKLVLEKRKPKVKEK